MSVIRDGMYTRMKFVKSKKVALHLAELALDAGYVKIPIDWKEQNFKLHLKKHVYQAYNQIRHNSQSLMRKITWIRNNNKGEKISLCHNTVH